MAKYSNKDDNHHSPHAGMSRDEGGGFRSSSSIAGESPNGEWSTKKFGPKNCSWDPPKLNSKADLDDFTENYGDRNEDQGDGGDWK